jgi:hypothetical protein
MCTSQKFVYGSGLLLKVGLKPYHKFCSCFLEFCTVYERHALISTLGHHKYNAWHKHCCLLMMTACNWMTAVSSHLIGGTQEHVQTHSVKSHFSVMQSNREMNSVQILFDWASYNIHLYYPQFIIADSNCHFTCTLQTWFMCNKGTVHAMKACRGVDTNSYTHATSARDRRMWTVYAVISLPPWKAPRYPLDNQLSGLHR